MSGNIYLYIAVMAVVTYLIRLIPITFIRGKIKSRFIRSFLYYVPYVTLGAMTVPSIFHAAGSLIPSLAGFTVALILSFRGKSLPAVAAGASLAVLLVELIPLV